MVPTKMPSTDRELSWLRRAGTRLGRLYKQQLYRFRRLLLHARIPYRPGGRKWGIDLPLKALDSIQAGGLHYSYRGISMLKNPFEVALYPLLLWQVKPRTVVEIGSYRGASALWLADTMRNFALPREGI